MNHIIEDARIEASSILQIDILAHYRIPRDRINESMILSDHLTIGIEIGRTRRQQQ
jgi:hypothetical protein